jgi:uncharacterized membrane protein
MASPSLTVSDISEGSAIRITSAGHAAFAIATIALGVITLMTRELTAVWMPVPKWAMSAHPAFVYLWAFISIGAGLALFVRRSSFLAAQLLFAFSFFWLVAFRLPNLFYEKPLVLVGWAFGKTAIMVAAAWVLCLRFASDHDPSFVFDGRGLRVARALYGVSLIPFGLAHFMYLSATAPLIPSWLPWHNALAYFTGAAFIGAGLAMMSGILGGLAAALSTLEFGLFGLIVWVPRVIAGNVTDFQRGEFIVTFVLAAAGWVVADSYRRGS